MNSYQNAVGRALARRREDEARWAAQRRQFEIHSEQMQVHRHMVEAASRMATEQDYLAWLEGFTARGGDITHVYDYAFPARDWRVMQHPVTLRGLYGVLSLSLIIPANITVTVEERGHCNLYFLDGYRGQGTVPFYTGGR